MGLRPSGKSDYPWDLPRENLSRRPICFGLFTVHTRLVAYLVYWKLASFHHLAAMPRITSTITLGARVCSNVSSNVQVQVQVQVQVCRCRCRCTIATIANVQCAVQYLTSSYSRQAVSRKSPFLR